MQPTLFGSFPAYPIFVVLAVFLGTLCSIAQLHQAVLLSRVTVAKFVGVMITALVGAKLHGLLETMDLSAMVRSGLTGGFRLSGGVLGALVGLLCFFPPRGEKNWGELADIAAVSAALAMSVIRVGCLLAGCCSGDLCDLPWAISFPAYSQVWFLHVSSGLIPSTSLQSAAVHPFQVYLGGWSLAVFCILNAVRSKCSFQGQIALLYVVLAFGGKFLLESFRFGDLAHVQYSAGAAAVLGSAVLAASLRRQAARRVSR